MADPTPRERADAERLATLAERRDLKASIMRSAGSPEDNIGFLLRLLREAEAERDGLRKALLDAITVFDIGQETRFRQHYFDLIARAQAWSLK